MNLTSRIEVAVAAVHALTPASEPHEILHAHELLDKIMRNIDGATPAEVEAVRDASQRLITIFMSRPARPRPDLIVSFGDGNDDDALRNMLGHLADGEYIVSVNGDLGRIVEVAPDGRWALRFQPLRSNGTEYAPDGDPELVWFPEADGAPEATMPVELTVH